MAIDLPVVVLIAFAALLVSSSVARRAGEHADRVAGRRPVANAARRGPLGAVVDLVDESVAAYNVRRRLGLSTKTRSQRRVDASRAALVARADEIRRLRSGAIPPVRPTHLVVSGRAGEAPVPPRAPSPPSAPRGTSPTLPFELIAAAVGLVLVVGIVFAIAPRETGDVLSATGRPAVSAPAIPTPTPSPTPSLEPAAS
ncbi:MAG TPA: hypothetical protein VGQ89_15610 [Candidatus Limnocylindrales bacterium]|jgi:hypothetical protein|nr:hypothetical protein [Candidatus Limnocylindrales bacterium]